ncbi:MAG: VWA domain-containing protein [Lewinellaceae bacterium]|nr:VWA domain-containing protein [Lewinellaceae bacterium]
MSEPAANLPLTPRYTSLSAHVVSFCRFLRQNGFPLGPAEESLALQALSQLTAFRQPEAFRLCLRATLARSKTQQQRFDVLFPQYFKELENAVDAKTKTKSQGGDPKQKQQKAPTLQALKSWLYGQNSPEDEVALAGYSAQEATHQKDFANFTDDELREVWGLVQQIARTLALQLSRRWEHTHHNLRLDLRRTIRRNLRRGGELLELAHRRPKRHRQQLLVLCDVSKSMDLYSQFLLQFSYAFQQAYRRIETFTFSTDLQRITPLLRGRDFRAALEGLQQQQGGWSGGTRIGASLASLCQHYRRLLTRQTIVIILSDGMDTGEIETLSTSMQTIHRRAGRVIWLNPLAGRPGYTPSTRGMEAALPYIDVFAAAHNVESLRRLARYLANHPRSTSPVPGGPGHNIPA